MTYSAKHISMRMITLFISILLLAFHAQCSSDNEDSDEDTSAVTGTIKLSTSEILMKAVRDSATFTITSDVSWNVSVPASGGWCKVDKTSGTNNATIEVTVEANPKIEERSTRITIKSSAGNKYVEIKQEAKEPDPEPEPEETGVYLPLLTITTVNKAPILDRTNYIKGAIKIESRNDAGIVSNTLLDIEMTEDGIRGRGNSSWNSPKKPYRIKLDKSVEILGMPKSKHWVLLANYSDKTLMRNSLVFEISNRMEYAYTPRFQHVDVVLNGEYVGNYMLGEQIRIDKNRVNIAELKPTSENITGGYLFEIDERKDEADEAFYVDTKGKDMNGSHKLVVAVKNPELADITDAQKQYVVDHFQNIEDALYGRDGKDPATEFPKWVDMKSFIDNFLINEISKNVDGNLRLSTFMYKKEDDNLLYFGPVWDYDIAFGNADYGGGDATTGWMSRGDRWYREFFRIPKFDQMVKDRWKELRSNQLSESNLALYISETAKKLETSQEKNFEKWKILGEHVWPNPAGHEERKTYASEVYYLKEFLLQRAKWMDTELK